MLKNLPNTALLLFSRTPAEEVRCKKLIPRATYEQQFKLAANFISHSQATLAATGLPCFFIFSEDQIGHTFAERLYNAFAQVFDLGFDQVISIGNDCPQLKPQDLLHAAHILSDQEVVLGPDKVGGLYLIGLTRRVFQECASFSAISWNTSNVFAEAENFFKSMAATWVLQNKYLDLNNHQALNIILKNNLQKNPGFKFIKKLIKIFIPWWPTSQESGITTASPKSSLFRGPPFQNLSILH